MGFSLKKYLSLKYTTLLDSQFFHIEGVFIGLFAAYYTAMEAFCSGFVDLGYYFPLHSNITNLAEGLLL